MFENVSEAPAAPVTAAAATVFWSLFDLFPQFSFFVKVTVAVAGVQSYYTVSTFIIFIFSFK